MPKHRRKTQHIKNRPHHRRTLTNFSINTPNRRPLRKSSSEIFKEFPQGCEQIVNNYLKSTQN